MTALDQSLLNIAAGFAAGLIIGIERGWTLRGAEDGSRVAGIRTFTLFGLLAGIAGYLARDGYQLTAAILVASSTLIVALGYWKSMRETGQPDATSALAATLVLALGFLAGMGQAALAVAGAAVVTLLLALRTEVHRWVGSLDEADIKAFARYAVIALAIYPLLPQGRYGPYDAWEPTSLWLVVIIVTGFSFAGYIANRLMGTRRGTVATAVIGGAYSSTAVTLSFAQRLGAGSGGSAEVAGIALATSVMYLRVIVLVAILANRLLVPFVVAVAPALVVGSIASYLLYRRSSHSSGKMPTGNPIALLPALGFVAFVAAAAVAARWAEGRFGEEGIAVLLLLMGSMDVDAAIVTAGGLDPSTITAALAALAIGGTIVANMAVKIGITLVYGRREGRLAALALCASTVTLAASLAIGYLRL